MIVGTGSATIAVGSGIFATVFFKSAGKRWRMASSESVAISTCGSAISGAR